MKARELMSSKVMGSEELHENNNPFETHQGGDEDIRIELTVKLKDKLETKDIEDREIQSEDVMIIDAGVKSEVKIEMVRVDEEDEGITRKQLTINLMESNLENVSFHIPLQTMDPKEEWYPTQIQEPIIMRRVEDENKNQELVVIYLKSQLVQALHEIVSHQGAVELQDRDNKENVVIEDREEKELLQIENRVFKEIGISHSSATTLKGKGKGEVLPTRSNPRRGARNGSK
ncbi:hypothetical protein KY285_010921 [Solanum tuberosum]|nr:hypothetical protein KY289_011495 [Solanum tuberosum]KAH0735214.1 hypothetical protein KY285_010921 [Solanum tuberosum]